MLLRGYSILNKYIRFLCVCFYRAAVTVFATCLFLAQTVSANSPMHRPVFHLACTRAEFCMDIDRSTSRALVGGHFHTVMTSSAHQQRDENNEQESVLRIRRNGLADHSSEIASAGEGDAGCSEIVSCSKHKQNATWAAGAGV